MAIFLWMSATVLYAQTPSWKVQYDSAQRYWGSQWNKAIPFLTKAEQAALYDLGIYDENYLTILSDLGLAYAKTGDYKNAEKALTKVISITNEAGEDAESDRQRAYLNLAAVYSEQRHFDLAEPLYLKVLNEPNGDAQLLAPALKGITALYESSNRAANALALLNNPRYADVTTTQEWQIIRARLARKDGQYGESMRILGSVDPTKDTDQLQQLVLLHETALNHLETASFNLAEKEFLELLQKLNSKAPGETVLLTAVLNDLATLYEKLGLREKALTYYQQALPLCQKIYGVNSVNSLTLQSNIAGIYLSNGLVQQAIAQYQLVEKQLSKIVTEGNSDYLTVLNNLGTAYRANREGIKAKQMFERALTAIDKFKLADSDLAATVMNNLAVLLTTFDELSKAATLYERAYNIRKNIYGPTSVKLAEIAGNLAVVYWETGQTERSLPLFAESSALAIRQVKYIFPNLSEDEQVQFYRRLKEDFERFNSIAFRASSRQPALLTQVFNNQLTLKSLRFFTQRHRSDLARENNDTALTSQFDELRVKREQLGALYQRTLNELSRTAVSTVELEQEIDALEKAISLKTSGALSATTNDRQVSWLDLQKKMAADDALIEVIRYRKYDLRRLNAAEGARVMFGFTDSVYYAALITTRDTKANPQLVLMKDGRNMEKRNLSYYRNALTYAVADEQSYDAYWGSIGKRVGSRRNIFFSADGVYHQVNLNTLLDPGSKTFIADRHEIHYLINPLQYLEQGSRAVLGKRAVLFGDPNFDGALTTPAKQRSAMHYAALPGTRTEVQSIDALLRSKGWTTQVKLRDQATERNLKEVRNTDILHVATHGFFSIKKINPGKEFKPDISFNSGLMLTGANKSLQDETREYEDDGVLTAYEVTNLDLTGTSLVVLSACETGLGNIEIGEGVFGLQRSFLQAGAQNVLISLWKVDDNITRELMTQFYTHLAAAPSIHRALMNAQQDVRKKHSDPADWGSFILIGK